MEESTDDDLVFGIKGLKEIYKEYSMVQEQQMDTTKEPKGAEGMEQMGKTGQTSGLMIKIKKSEKPKVLKSILQYEPPVMRRRSSMTPEKMLGE